MLTLLAVELADLISELDMNIDAITFYTDSKVVLGYINKETRHFYVYVSNRIVHIQRSPHPKQWKYVPTEENPADCATRSVPAASHRHLLAQWATVSDSLCENF